MLVANSRTKNHLHICYPIPLLQFYSWKFNTMALGLSVIDTTFTYASEHNVRIIIAKILPDNSCSRP